MIPVPSLKFQEEISPLPVDRFVKAIGLLEQVLFGEKLKFATGGALIVNEKLRVDVTAGLVLTILILYPFPDKSPQGKHTGIAKAVVLVIDPICVGVIKLPDAFDN